MYSVKNSDTSIREILLEVNVEILEKLWGKKKCNVLKDEQYTSVYTYVTMSVIYHFGKFWSICYNIFLLFLITSSIIFQDFLL